MTAILFGSISTIADTSELQRTAFNDAFRAHGLDWTWELDEYRRLLERSGGQQRIADYARERDTSVDAAAIHHTKSELFQKALADGGLTPRAGVGEAIRAARDAGVKLAFVSTTSDGNIAGMLGALDPDVSRADFDFVFDGDTVDAPKPDKAVAYVIALERLGERAEDCIAIEDNLAGVAAAHAAGLACVAFPNANTAGHDFGIADHRVERIDLDDLRQFLAAA